uniref:Uncharacterized protein LOC100176726 n=1 Tax=Phallusia mammillata TaxID=59560 RepID=A0A6F9DH98_9ASCI|nr:uncharacterized protein LOC100176726 [Phallusia mammillata]
MAGLLKELSQDKSLENNLEFLQQIAQRNYLVNGDESKPFYQLMTALRIGNEVYQRVSGQRKIDEYRAQCAANIIAYVKANPNASNNVLKKEVENQVAMFAVKVQSM